MYSTSTATRALSPAFLEQLEDVAAEVVRDIEGAVHATILIVQHGQPWASVFTHPDAEALNEIERDVGGPAVDALWSGRITRIQSTLRSTEWPEYRDACQRVAISSVASFPISVDGERIGTMTVASDHYFGFGPEETRIAIDAATRAAAVLQSSPRC